MSSQRLLRLGGGALIVGSVLVIISDALALVIGSPQDSPPPPSAAIFGLLGAMFIVTGLPGILVRQAAKAGLFGLIGWIVFLWNVLSAVTFFTFATVFYPSFYPLLPKAIQEGPPPDSMLAFFITLTILGLVSGVLLGIATLRARVFSPAIGWLFIASGIATAAAFPLEGVTFTAISTVSDLLLMTALGWSGYLLIKTSEATAQEALSATQAARA